MALNGGNPIFQVITGILALDFLKRGQTSF